MAAMAGVSFSAECSTVCSKQVDYVCGTNNVTYLNTCILAVDTCKSNGKITAAFDGECGSPATTKIPTATGNAATGASTAPQTTTATPTTTLKSSSSASVAATLTAMVVSTAAYSWL
ncbi:hypothetical protein AeRB84_010080 [Aphanomyces euteiches]|nr:hypothetical protein AeRB84_010080 [Aphanomyces euteiches]